MNKKHFIALAMLCGALCAASPARAQLTHHWTFDEGTGVTTADVVGSNPGAINGALWGTGTGDRASYLIFAGASDNVDPSLTLPINTQTNDFSWAVWVNSQEEFDDGSGNQRNSIILGNRRDGTGTNTDLTPREFAKLTPRQFEYRPNDTGGLASDYTNIPLDAWTHLAVVKEGVNITTYFNGVAEGTPLALGADNNFNNALPFFIGGETGNPGGEHFNGFIDDVRIYSSALSAAEVGELAGVSVVPEPSTFGLAMFALVGAAARRRRRA